MKIKYIMIKMRKNKKRRRIEGEMEREKDSKRFIDTLRKQRVMEQMNREERKRKNK